MVMYNDRPILKQPQEIGLRIKLRMTRRSGRSCGIDS